MEVALTFEYDEGQLVEHSICGNEYGAYIIFITA